MTYTLAATVEDSTTDVERSLVQMVDVSIDHLIPDFEDRTFRSVNRFRFETGYQILDDGRKVECTRILMSCKKDHNHGVYYQAPRAMELWEAMFAVGETPHDGFVDPEGDK